MKETKGDLFQAVLGKTDQNPYHERAKNTRKLKFTKDKPLV